ncbi:polysaccharide biosynthesis protein [Listeria sp. SHR_NRA_18]|uniref:lipopolysaccharide biosynthesis protein n=1 Tax=Listeria sp. SHR_NRA_18 TaxID=2269046 RepID=UPI00051DE8EB|nr:oligosaccharide flippase family protein [Listeria sp. SHR_NRA_18]KGL39144.1 hypothetical protein EP56_14645 [Listeriaceae bacterium FSL A5-0209]RQW66365.1 polysaccharide biosynthesis protein [Listeria sp. SHR_NRA_18]
MHSGIKRFFQFSIGPVVGAAISFITIPVTTYFISPDEYGKASMFLLIQMLIATYVYFGLDQAYTREYNETTEKRNLIQNAMVIPLLIATLISLLLIFFRHHITVWLFDETAGTMLIYLLVISVYTLVFERFFLLAVRMEEKAKRYSFLTIMIRLMVLVVTLLFLFVGTRDFTVVVYGTLIGQIMGDIIIIILSASLLNVKDFQLDKKLIRKMCLFGFPVFIAFAIEAIFQASDRFIIGVWSDYTELGLYTAALKIVGLLKIVQSSFTSFWIPTAYRWHAEKKEIRYFQWVSDMVTGSFAVLFLLMLLAKNSILLLFTEEYAGIVYIFPFLCFAPILYTISETTTLGIVFSRKTHLNIYVSVGAVITNIILALWLVPIYGAKGASLSIGVAYFAYYLLRTILSNREWPGIRMKKQLCTIALLFFAGMYNTFFTEYIYIINSVLLGTIILVYLPIFKQILRRKERN